MNMLNPAKAAQVNPFFSGQYTPPPYVQPGTVVSVTIGSRQQEQAILAAHDYGLEALSEDGQRQIECLIADLKVAITGR